MKTFPDRDYPVSDSEEIQTWSPGEDKMVDGLTRVRVEQAGDRMHDEKDKLSAACKLLGLSEGFELDGACKENCIKVVHSAVCCVTDICFVSAGFFCF